MTEDVIIIGAGLAGLTAAYALKKQGIDALILESNNRLGGRIYTKSNTNQSFELGATWVFQDPVLKRLITELGLELYPQYLNGTALVKYDPSMEIQRRSTAALMNGAIYHKVEGGTGAIIQALADQLDPDHVLLNKKVVELVYENDSVKLTTADGSILTATNVIITVPPKVFADQIQITPQLNSFELMHSSHTWMGESSKFTVLFDKDYWRSEGLSGFVFSNYGLIREMQDHSSEDGNSFGLVGFMQPKAYLTSDFEKRKQTVIQELIELFDIHEGNILAYDDFLWGEYFVDSNGQNYNTGLVLHQNNGHSIYLNSHFDHHLFFAGAETSPSNPGYMEGAVKSAYHAADLLITNIG